MRGCAQQAFAHAQVCTCSLNRPFSTSRLTFPSTSVRMDMHPNVMNRVHTHACASMSKGAHRANAFRRVANC
eukprot:3711356-Pleurochrysis_carterae.AAC.6